MSVGVPALTVKATVFVAPAAVVAEIVPAPVGVLYATGQVAVIDVSDTAVTAVQEIAAPDEGCRVTAEIGATAEKPEPVNVTLTLFVPPEPLPRVALVGETLVRENAGEVTVKAVVAVPPGVVTPKVPAPAAVPIGKAQDAVT